MEAQIFGAFLRTQPREPGMAQALRKVHCYVKNMPDGS